MSGSLWSLTFVALVAALLVRFAAVLARGTDLSVLPRSRRHRVEWCRVHCSQVEVVTGVLLAGLLAGQLALR